MLDLWNVFRIFEDYGNLAKGIWERGDETAMVSRAFILDRTIAVLVAGDIGDVRRPS